MAWRLPRRKGPSRRRNRPASRLARRWASRSCARRRRIAVRPSAPGAANPRPAAASLRVDNRLTRGFDSPPAYAETPATLLCGLHRIPGPGRAVEGIAVLARPPDLLRTPASHGAASLSCPPVAPHAGGLPPPRSARPWSPGGAATSAPVRRAARPRPETARSGTEVACVRRRASVPLPVHG